MRVCSAPSRKNAAPSHATFDVVIYSYLGMFKIVMVAFSIVPYLALLAIA